MENNETHLYRAMRANGFVRDRDGGKSISYSGNLAVEDRQVPIRLVFKDTEFVELPGLYLTDRSLLQGRIAHIEGGGKVCYARPRSVLLDRFDINQAVAKILSVAATSLKKIIGEDFLSDEIAQEFPQHWLGDAYFHYFPAAKSGHAKFAGREALGKHKSPILYSTINQLLDLGVARSRVERVDNNARNCIHLVTDTPLFFADGQKTPDTYGEFLRWLDSISHDLVPTLDRLMAHLYPKDPYIFVQGPNGCVCASLMLSKSDTKICQRKVSFAKLLARLGDRIRVLRLSGRRTDLPYMMDRNFAGNSGLSDKIITLIGCGTIGSHLAKFLAQSGAGFGSGQLRLIDNDVLNPGNIGRHFLGPEYIDRHKVEACSEEIKRSFPAHSIIPIAQDLRKVMELMDDSDLVIDATGEEGLSNYLNAYLVEGRRRGAPLPEALFVWLEGNGVAAQAILTGLPDTACYRCLQPQYSVQSIYSPLGEGYKMSEEPATCGEAPYVPYGVAASSIAAGLAAQMVCDWANEKNSPTLRTIRVDHSNTRDIADQTPKPVDRCPACGAASAH